MDASILSLLGQFQRLEYLQVASHIFFLCDYLQQLPREVNAIWLSKSWGRLWPFGRLLYFICRYTTFYTLGTVIYSMVALPQASGMCLRLGISSSWVTFIGMYGAQLVLSLRLYALWRATRFAGLVLAMFSVAMFGAGVTINVLIMRSTTLLRPPINDPAIIPNCYLIVEGQPELAMWGVLSTVIADVLMVMVVCAQLKLRYSLETDSLARKVLWDTIYYSVLNLFIGILSILLFHFPEGPVKQASGIIPSILVRCLSCHIVLRLREHSNDGLFSTTGPSLGPLEFHRTVVPVSEGMTSN